MRSVLPLLFVFVVGCDQKSDPTTAQTAAGQTAELIPAPSAVADGGAPPDVHTAPLHGECGGLVGVQKVQLLPVDGDDGLFRFGTEEDALVYRTEWRGDLNDDGAEDQVAARKTKNGDKAVRIVLVQCDGEYALAWVGLADAVHVAPERSLVGERQWHNLGIETGRGTKTVVFNGQKYAEN